MTPTPQQIIEAVRNHRRPPRTHHAKVRDALEHVRLSINKDAARRGGEMRSAKINHAKVTLE